MATKKPKPTAKPDCPLCHGKGWFYAGHIESAWPTECHRCFPSHPNVVSKARSGAQPQR